jgi:nanoRNase/pAp phosphatase (c-di-AMP/oligoRNAs hydrolase)
VVFEHYGGKSRFPASFNDMMLAVDKGDSAQFTRDDILNPRDWVLLNYLMDSRTGLGRFREFRVSNYQLMMDLIAYCRNHGIADILALPDVKERVDLYFEHAEKAKEQIRRCTKLYKNLAVLDLRNEETIFAVNRFMIYALVPEANISIHLMWGVQKQNTVFATGKSIINRSSNTNIGELMLSYGGGGHENAGTCQIANDKADAVLQELTRKINADG